jgi:hypothetical protein
VRSKNGIADQHHAAREFSLWALKAAALWIVLIGSGAVVTQVIGHMPTVPDRDGPLSSLQAMFAVNGAIAIALAMLAARARVKGIGLAVLLFVTLFSLQSGMMIVDGLWFNDSLQMPLEDFVAWGEQALIVSTVVGCVAALMFHPASEAAAAVPSNIFWRVVWLSAIYVFLYFAAGSFAWQSEALRAYYANMHISLGPTVALQFGRGILWAIISLFIVTRIKGSLTSRAVLMGVLFCVLTAGQLLYSNSVMPWSIRQVHLLEVGTSELIYGVVATYVLLARASRKPLAATSPWRLIVGKA